MKYNILVKNLGAEHPFGIYNQRKVLSDGSIEITLTGKQPWAAVTGEMLVMDNPYVGQAVYLTGHVDVIAPAGLTYNVAYRVIGSSDYLSAVKAKIGNGTAQRTSLARSRVQLPRSYSAVGIAVWTTADSQTAGKKLLITEAMLGVNEPHPLPWILGGGILVGGILIAAGRKGRK